MARESKLDIVVQLKDKASKKLKKVGNEVKKMDSKMQEAKKTSLMFAGGLTAMATGVGYLGKEALKAAGQYEQSQIAFSTMLGSAEKAEAMLTDLAQFAKKTPFELRGIEQSSKQLLAMGISSGNLMPTLKALGDVSAGLSVPMSRLALNFGQVKTQGKLTGRELRDFAKAGVPLLGELSKQLGVSKARIREMVSEGKIGFAEVQEAFVAMTSEGGKFENLMGKQSTTLQGLIANLRDSWNLFLRDEGARLLEWGKGFIRVLIYIVNNVLPKMVGAIEDVIVFMGKWRIITFALAGAIAGALVPAIYGAVSGMALLIKEFIIANAPFIAIGALIGIIVGAIVILLTHLDEAKYAVKIFANAIKRLGFQMRIWDAQITGNEWAVEHYTRALSIAKREAEKMTDEFLYGERKSSKLEKALKKLKGKLDVFKQSGGDTTEALKDIIGEMEKMPSVMDKVGSSADDMGDSLKKSIDKTINRLRDLQDAFLGLSDKEINKLQEVASAHKEKMDIIEERKKAELEGRVTEKGMEIHLEHLRETSEAYKKHAKKYEEATKRINKLKMKKPVTPISAITEWAKETKSTLEEKIQARGLTPPTTTYPRLQPITTTPQQAVNNFNFNFEGALISDPEAFKKDVVDLLNKMSERKALGGQ